MARPADRVSAPRLWAALTVVGALLGGYSLAPHAEQQAPSPFEFRFYPNRGGDFRLLDQHGQAWSLASARGKVVLLTFGYTHCPDICPATLANLSAALAELGNDRGAVTPVFVSLDPVRDTSLHLSIYLANFDAAMVGLTGTEGEVRSVAQRYRVKYEARDGGPNLGVTIDHTAFVYLIDPQGRLRYLFPHTTPPDRLAGGVRQLLRDNL